MIMSIKNINMFCFNTLTPKRELLLIEFYNMEFEVASYEGR